MTDALTEHQNAVAERVLDEQERAREHLVVHLSGAHAYGFASVDSDLDLKGIHVAPTEAFLGLDAPHTSSSFLEVIDGVEIDYGSNEVAQAVRGLLRGDGNMLERVMSQSPLRSGESLPELRHLATASLSRRYHAHYRGFARSQHHALEKAERPTAKKLLYVLRTTLTGAHLLETGRCEPELTALADDAGFPEAHELVDLKREHEGQPLPARWLELAPALVTRAFERLDASLHRTPLPEEPSEPDALEAWLVALRRSRL